MLSPHLLSVLEKLDLPAARSKDNRRLKENISLSHSHAHPPASLSVTALLHFPFLFSLRLILPVVVLTGFQEVFGVRGRGHMPLNHHDALSVEQEKEEEERQRSSELIFDEGMRYNLRKKNGSEIFLCDLTPGSKSVS